MLGSLDEQLRPRRARSNAWLPVRPDLGLDPERAEDREGAPRDRRLGEIEVEGERSTPEQVHGARGVEERRELREAVAAALGRDGGELRPRVPGERRRAQSSVPSSASRRRLRRSPDESVAAELVRLLAPGGDDPVARHDEREAVAGAERAGGPRGARPPGERGEPAVRDDLAPRDGPRRFEELALERAEPVTSSATSSYVDAHAGEMRRESPAQIRHEADRLCVTPRRLA